MEFDFKDKQICDAAIITAVDFRFLKIILQGVKDVFGISTYDLWTMPGVAKIFVSPDLENFAKEIIEKINTVSIGLHNIQTILLINHSDCAAYGGRKSFENIDAEKRKHKEDLLAAKNILQEYFPQIDIKLGYADLSEEQGDVRLMEVV